MINNLETDFLAENIKLCVSGEGAECHRNAWIVFNALKKKGYSVKLCTGTYANLPKVIRHSWIETEDKILETDCRQLRVDFDIMPDEFCAVLNKKKFSHRYKILPVEGLK